MARIEGARIAVLASVVLLAPGCARAPDEGAQPAANSGAVKSEAIPARAPALAAVDQSLKAGEFDNAAAQLLEMQASGKEFSEREAADYRRSMNEAYSRALEAAEKGDARAQAAIQMIRAANKRR